MPLRGGSEAGHSFEDKLIFCLFKPVTIVCSTNSFLLIHHKIPFSIEESLLDLPCQVKTRSSSSLLSRQPLFSPGSQMFLARTQRSVPPEMSSLLSSHLVYRGVYPLRYHKRVSKGITLQYMIVVIYILSNTCGILCGSESTSVETESSCKLST